MVNTRAKGNRIQRKCIELFEDRGYLVSKVELGGKFVKEKDLFGLFDLVAIKKGEVCFIQVTCNRPHLHKPYQEFSSAYHNNSLKFYQYVHMDRKGWKKFSYYMGNVL